MAAVDYQYSPALVEPTSHWNTARLPLTDFFSVYTGHGPSPKVMWVRTSIEPGRFNTSQLAWSTDFTSEHFILFLNGVEIYRNYSDLTDASFAAYRPSYVPLPHYLLRPGQNVISVRLESQVYWTLGVGNMEIGSAGALNRLYQRRYFMRTQLPEIANAILGTLTLFVTLLWLRRRHETDFGWLALMGALWWIRNLRYYMVAPPFLPPWLVWEIVINTLFVLMLVYYRFSASYFKLPNRTFWNSAVLSCVITSIIARYVTTAFGYGNEFSYCLIVGVLSFVHILFLRVCFKTPTLDNIIMTSAITINNAIGVHDLAFDMHLINGVGASLLPVGSLFVYISFSYVLGRRFLDAIDTMENMSVVLENRVHEATTQLHSIEATLRIKEVASALEQERARIMREMHDSVGSSLITALAVAEHNDADVRTIKTLRRSLADLRIAVDSLESVEGDLTALLANFRHRTEPDLRAAGWRFDWQVQEVTLLTWLDPNNALHIFRILQEALGNALAHSGGDVFTVMCESITSSGQASVRVVLTDNGGGMTIPIECPGKGIANMEARARAIGARLWLDSGENRGARVTIVLPVERFATGP